MSRHAGPVFTASADTWAGGGYELAVELGPPSDARLHAALGAALAYPAWDGPYRRRDVEPEEQERAPREGCAGGEDGSRDYQGYGVALLPDGRRAASGVTAFREEGEPVDRLVVFVPLGGLAKTYPDVGGYPFGIGRTTPEPAAWERCLLEWLVGFGRHLYAAVPFRLGVTGFDVAGEYRAEEMAASGGVPAADRWNGFLWPEAGGARLGWYPPTQYGAQYTLGAGGAE